MDEIICKKKRCEADEDVAFTRSNNIIRLPAKYKHKEENKLDKMLMLLEKLTSEVQELKKKWNECAKEFNRLITKI